VKEQRLSSWEDFETEIASLFERKKKIQAEKGMRVYGPFFRGHAAACWKLETTLERYTERCYPTREYYDVMRTTSLAVESFTEKFWNLSDKYEIDESIPGLPLGYEFMIYLRHHGFPSPLLDWTHSPYIAAFFSFRSKAPFENNDVAIYSHLVYSWSPPSGMDCNKARIDLLGPYVTAHKRHYTQQSWYTICRKPLGNKYVYCNHEEAIEENSTGQGLLRKYVIPRSERSKVLDKLFLMNINSYSLFGSEESLMETLAYREIEENEKHL